MLVGRSWLECWTEGSTFSIVKWVDAVFTIELSAKTVNTILPLKNERYSPKCKSCPNIFHNCSCWVSLTARVQSKLAWNCNQLSIPNQLSAAMVIPFGMTVPNWSSTWYTDKLAWISGMKWEQNDLPDLVNLVQKVKTLNPFPLGFLSMKITPAWFPFQPHIVSSNAPTPPNLINDLNDLLTSWNSLSGAYLRCFMNFSNFLLDILAWLYHEQNFSRILLVILLQEVKFHKFEGYLLNPAIPFE